MNHLTLINTEIQIWVSKPIPAW